MAKADITLDASRITEQLAQAIEKMTEPSEDIVMPIKVGFMRMDEDAVFPTKAHETDSGFDLVACENVLIPPGATKIIPTGIAVQLPEGYEAQVRPRSGVTTKTGLRVQLGTIDNGYIGAIGVIADNTHSLIQSVKQIEYMDGSHATTAVLNGGKYISIRKGDRIAQLVIQELPMVEAYIVKEMGESDRGSGGFGSTGVSV